MSKIKCNVFSKVKMFNLEDLREQRKQGAIDELIGIINILEQYKNDKLPAKSFIQFYNKRLKELER
jgi:hypothetical protein